MKYLESGAKQADSETMAIKLKREELPRYAACIKLEQFLSKKVRKVMQTRFRRILQATFIPTDLDVSSLVKIQSSSKNSGTFGNFADKLADLMTQDSSPKQMLRPSPVGLSISAFTD